MVNVTSERRGHGTKADSIANRMRVQSDRHTRDRFRVCISPRQNSSLFYIFVYEILKALLCRGFLHHNMTTTEYSQVKNNGLMIITLEHGAEFT